MTFALTAEQLEIRDAVARLCRPLRRRLLARRRTPRAASRTNSTGRWPRAGWLGIAMPEEYGGSGLGITEAAVMMQAVAAVGRRVFSGASAIHMNIFGLHPVVVFGTDEQKRRFLPPLIAGDEKACFAVTEPDAGLDTTRLKTRAVRRRRPLCPLRPQDLDLDRAGRREDADPRAHDAVRGGGAAVARA